MTDELTGVPNRRAVLSLLSQMLRRDDEPHSILIIDVDHFKSINDRHGHLIGDEALRQISANLRVAVDEPAFFGRLGGEEFAAVLPGCDPDEARGVAENLRERVMRLDLSRFLGDRRLTVSIGIATSIPGRDSITTMLLEPTARSTAPRTRAETACAVNPPATKNRSRAWLEPRHAPGCYAGSTVGSKPAARIAATTS